MSRGRRSLLACGNVRYQGFCFPRELKITHACHRHWYRSPDHGRAHDPPPHGRGYPSCRGHGRRGCENGRGHGGRNHGRDGHPCGESSHHGYGGEVWHCDHDEGRHRACGGGHGRNQSARRQTEECGPTAAPLATERARRSLRTYLDLQQVIATDALVVHLVIGIISITARLILNECEAVA